MAEQSGHLEHLCFFIFYSGYCYLLYTVKFLHKAACILQSIHRIKEMVSSLRHATLNSIVNAVIEGETSHMTLTMAT